VICRVLETLGFEGEHPSPSRPRVPLAPSLYKHSMPPRITQESYRPRVSDRTIVANAATVTLASFRTRRVPLMLYSCKPHATSSKYKAWTVFLAGGGGALPTDSLAGAVPHYGMARKANRGNEMRVRSFQRAKVRWFSRGSFRERAVRTSGAAVAHPCQRRHRRSVCSSSCLRCCCRASSGFWVSAAPNRGANLQVRDNGWTGKLLQAADHCFRAPTNRES